MIGQFVARFKGDIPQTKAHLVDSEVAGDIFTNCGRRIKSKSGTRFVPWAAGVRCKQCS